MFYEFFRINLPYSICRTNEGEWYTLNREYVPIGFNDRTYNHRFEEMGLPIFTKYEGLTKELLLSIADNDPHRISWDKEGEICEVWLYNDRTNPTSQAKDSPQLWVKYFQKLKLLSNLDVNYKA
ncbi:hypothetical protein [Spirosoma flavum]|uniref:Uncharacterized protein n=1 Tax=Spirosoma flavum TaxID=2048557 RepID=A0ABW6ANE9_9BACT